MDGSTYTGRSLVHEVYEGDVVVLIVFSSCVYIFDVNPFGSLGPAPGPALGPGPGPVQGVGLVRPRSTPPGVISAVAPDSVDSIERQRPPPPHVLRGYLQQNYQPSRASVQHHYNVQVVRYHACCARPIQLLACCLGTIPYTWYGFCRTPPPPARGPRRSIKSQAQSC